jgi:hypothetical protein
VVTGEAVAVKPAEVAPAATATEAGTVKLVLFEESPTAAPPAGAALLNVTVQLRPVQARAETRVGAMIETLVLSDPFREAVTAAVWSAATEVLLAVKPAEVAPPATATETGTLNAALFEERLTTDPPVSAGEFSDIVQDVDVPLAILDGEQPTAETCGAGNTIVRADESVVP